MLVELVVKEGQEENFLKAFKDDIETGVYADLVGFVRANWRPVLQQFASEMEAKLRKNDHKTGWHGRPIEALFELLKLEVAEFEVAYEYFEVTEARKELVDIANFALILHDRLGALNQDRTIKAQAGHG